MKKTTRMFLILFALLTIAVGALAQTNLNQSDAENLAFRAAGITADQATLLNTQTENEDGVEVYDIEFTANGLEYEFHLSVADGTILKSKWEADDAKMLTLAQSQTSDSVWIGEEQALTNALADASLAQADVTVTENKFDTDDLLKVYDITFFTADAEYEYEIDALSGEICAKSVKSRSDAQVTEKKSEKKTEKKAEKDSGKSQSAAETPSDESSSYIGVDRAKGVKYRSDAQVTEKKTEKKAEKDSGEAKSASETPSDESGSYIGVDRAKSIALNHAGLSESEVKFSKAKLEKDDGKRIYEIEFRVGNTEYEYEIDAKTGDILESDKDYDDD